MKKQINQLRTGVILSYINLGISFIIPFLYTPVMLRILGQSEYGLYSLANSVIGYLTLLTFGFGSTIIRYIAKYRAEGNTTAVQKMFGFFLLLYCALGIIVLFVGSVLSNNVGVIFHKGLTESEIEKVRILVLIMTVNTAISFPISVFSSIITAYEKYVYRRIIDMLSTIAAPLFNIIVLYLGFASVGMAVATTIIQIIMLPLNAGYCFKKLKICPKFEKIPVSLVKELFRFSFYIFVGTVVDMLFWSTDRVILGMLASSAAVAVYNIGGTFNNIIVNLSTSISGVLTPRITGMVVKESTSEQLTELFIRIGRLQYIIIALIISGFTVFGQAFISLWAGNDYSAAYYIAIFTMFPLCIPLIQNTGLSILVAKNKHQFRAVVYLIIAIINAVCTYLVVPYFGGLGAAFCSGLSYIVGQGIVMNIYYYKIIKLDIVLFWKNIIKMSIVPGSMLIVGLILNSMYTIRNWFTFFVLVIIFSMIYFAGMYVFCLNSYEKGILKSFVQKITSICKRKRY